MSTEQTKTKTQTSIDWVVLQDEDAYPHDVYRVFALNDADYADPTVTNQIAAITSLEDGDLPGVYHLAIARSELTAALVESITPTRRGVNPDAFIQSLVLETGTAVFDTIAELTERVAGLVYNDAHALKCRVVYLGRYNEKPFSNEGPDTGVIKREYTVSGEWKS